jgi:ATP-binding cassette subfamily B protein
MAWHIMGSLSKEGYDRQYRDSDLFKRLIPYLSKYRILLIFVTLLSIMDSFLTILAPFAFSIGFDELFKTNPNISFIYFVTGSYLFLLVISWLNRYVYSIQSSILESNIVFDLRDEIFRKVNMHDLSFFDRNKTGKIMSRISGDTFSVGGVLSSLVDLSSIVIQALLILIAMFAINTALTLITLFVFPILFSIVFLLRKIMRRYSTLQRRAQATVNAAVEESIAGIQVTKSFGQEKSSIDNYFKLQKQKTNINIKQSLIFSIFSPSLELLTAFGLFIILYFGGIATVSDVITPGFLYLFFVYLQRLFGPLINLSTFYATLQGGFAAGERIFSTMDVPTKMKSGNLQINSLDGEIDFRNVNFSYDSGKSFIFKNFSLFIPAGQVLAVVGETGAGKTSFASILTRMYEIESGIILLDNKYNIQDIEPDSLRNQIGYVLQDPFLFSGTIRDNLILGSPDANDKLIFKALSEVGANSFIDLLPNGINSTVLERGKGFSQGQKQLLALARVLIKDPKILVLDEATSSVDVYTEKMIQDAFNIVFKDRTTIIIAHRLSTILNADRIIVLQKGEIVEEGTHNVLISKKSHYRKLYQTYYAHQGSLEEIQIFK